MKKTLEGLLDDPVQRLPLVCVCPALPPLASSLSSGSISDRPRILRSLAFLSISACMCALASLLLVVLGGVAVSSMVAAVVSLAVLVVVVVFEVSLLLSSLFLLLLCWVEREER